ncbi:MAG TPA: response regulator transcription factor [Nocardioides sp.]|jgi:DNA-binding NarL/FixJ family response regulator
MTVRVALLGADELVKRGLDSMFRASNGRFQLVAVKDRLQKPIDILLVETFNTPVDDSSLDRAVRDPHVRRVAVYTWNHHPAFLDSLVTNGVSGYLAKSLTSAQLTQALLDIHAGQRVIAPSLGRLPSDDTLRGLEQGSLTARERETLAHIAMGSSNYEIARDMGLSVNSVKSYIRGAYRKIGAQTRSQAVLWTVAHGVRVDAYDNA